MTIREFVAKITSDVEKHGRSCLGVFPGSGSTDPNDAFVYTIGNQCRDLPELLIVGLCQDHGILNAASELMIERGRAFDDGEVISIGGAFPFCVIDAADDVKARYTLQATSFSGGADYRVMQIVLCDRQGRFPWDEDCAKPYADVKVWRRLQ